MGHQGLLGYNGISEAPNCSITTLLVPPTDILGKATYGNEGNRTDFVEFIGTKTG